MDAPTLHILHVLFLFFPFVFPLTKPGCQSQCGDLTVPYPFGIGNRSDCSIHPTFVIICNTSTDPPKAYIDLWRISEVIGITESQVRVKYPNVFVDCYNNSIRVPGTTSSFEIDIGSTPYSLSEDNGIVTFGCDDTLATQFGQGSLGGGGCVAYCPRSGPRNGSCPDYGGGGSSPGMGCCSVQVPRGTTSIFMRLANSAGYLYGGGKQFPCSYGIIGEKRNNGSFVNPWSSFPLDYLNDTTSFLTDNRTNNAPLVLDWRIKDQNCSQARLNSTTYACKTNSICSDVFAATTPGYICRCRYGYGGNPYLDEGCQDIDECASPILNFCTNLCTNTPGGFNCACPPGYFGDGTRNGTACTKEPKSKVINNVLIGLASGMGFLLILATVFWSRKLLIKRKKKTNRAKFFKRNGGLLLQQQTNEGVLGKTKIFSAKELEKATDDFNESRILGQGGQGTVYKGMLSDGKIVAIKKSKLIDEDQLEQFINEVAILSQINHRNIVKILGCCLEIEVPLLVYEFVPNGTLFDLIHDENTEFPVSWDMRLKIATDTAGALAYLHSSSSIPIYHRDIKSSNILLDEKYVAKVADFGTSRSVAVDQTHLTTLVKGTFGYLDPEYFQSSQFTEKSDVYSFGVVLVELLTGERAISSNRTLEERSLATRFLQSLESNCLDSILDAQVLEHDRKEDVISMARLAQKCLNLKGRMRPTMKEVATELESIRMSGMPSPIYEETMLHDAKSMLLPDSDYTWTTSVTSATTSSTDRHPLMHDTV